MKRFLGKFVAVSMLMASSLAHAGLISGFEDGLKDWTTLGDVSVQTAASGLAPTQGRNLVFLSTLGANETPYSGVASPASSAARNFLGIQTIPGTGCCDGPTMAGFPLVDTSMPGGGTLDYAMVGESAAIKTQFTVSHAGYVSFDWDRIGTDTDNAYYTIWSDELGSRLNGWIYEPHISTEPFTAIDVGLCARTTHSANGCSSYDAHTDWHEKRVWIDTPGTYFLGFGMNEIAEYTVGTVLAIDNVRFNVVPEPDGVFLFGLAGAALLLARRRRA